MGTLLEDKPFGFLIYKKYRSTKREGTSITPS